MKNIIKFFGLIALVAVIGFSFIACGDDDSNGGGSGNPFVGTWTGTMDGEYMRLTCTDTTWTTVGSDFGTYSGTYTRNGNTASFYVQGMGVGTATVSGNTMTGNIQGNGFTVTKSGSSGGGGGTAAPTINTTSLSAGTVGTSYSYTLSASGTTPIVWSIDSGSSLPNGLYINPSTGEISGMPLTSGTFSFTVKATNLLGSVTKLLSITIVSSGSGGGGTAPTITTTSLSAGIVGMTYYQTLEATGTTPIVWSIDSGSLPSVLYLNPTTGEISGTPTASGTFSFTVKATNLVWSVTKYLSITIVSNVSGGGSSINLTYNSWYTDNMNSNETHYYRFYASSGTYTIEWLDADNNPTYLADIKVGLKREGSSSYAVDVEDRSPTNNFTYSVSTSDYYIIEVQGFLNTSGQYRVRYY